MVFIRLTSLTTSSTEKHYEDGYVLDDIDKQKESHFINLEDNPLTEFQASGIIDFMTGFRAKQDNGSLKVWGNF